MNMQPKDGGMMSQEWRKKKTGRKKGTDVREGTNVPNVLEAESKGVSHLQLCSSSRARHGFCIYSVSLKACYFTDPARDSSRLTSKQVSSVQPKQANLEPHFVLCGEFLSCFGLVDIL